MSKKIFWLVIVAVLAVAFYMGNPPPKHKSAAGLPDPTQIPATGEVNMKLEEYDVNIKYKASYKIKALAVSTKNYSGTSIPDLLAKKDVALAWGSVAENNEKVDFNWSQDGRWYKWMVTDGSQLSAAGLSESDVNRHSANNHLIPADGEIKKEISKIRKGDIVEITGYLVSLKATKPEGETYDWNSSLTRTDTGNGACELIYVTGVTRE